MVSVLGFIVFILTDWYTCALYVLHLWAVCMNLPFIPVTISEPCFKSHYKRRNQFRQIHFIGLNYMCQCRSRAVGLRFTRWLRWAGKVQHLQSLFWAIHPLLSVSGMTSVTRRAKSITKHKLGEWESGDCFQLNLFNCLAVTFKGSLDSDVAWCCFGQLWLLHVLKCILENNLFADGCIKQ